MKTILATLLLSFALIAGEQRFDNIVVDSVVDVYDGDTFHCTIKDYPALIGRNIGVRLRGIDTPERRSPRHCEKVDADKVRQWVRDRLLYAKSIILTDVSRDKYFRIVATVIVDGDNLNEELIKIGYAVPYDGGFKKKWECK